MRPKKKRDFAAEITAMKAKIKKAESRVRDLKIQLKSIKNDQAMEVNQALLDAMGEKNFEIKDVLELVAKAPAAGKAAEPAKTPEKTQIAPKKDEPKKKK